MMRAELEELFLDRLFSDFPKVHFQDPATQIVWDDVARKWINTVTDAEWDEAEYRLADQPLNTKLSCYHHTEGLPYAAVLYKDIHIIHLDSNNYWISHEFLSANKNINDLPRDALTEWVKSLPREMSQKSDGVKHRLRVKYYDSVLRHSFLKIVIEGKPSIIALSGPGWIAGFGTGGSVKIGITRDGCAIAVKKAHQHFSDWHSHHAAINEENMLKKVGLWKGAATHRIVMPAYTKTLEAYMKNFFLIINRKIERNEKILLPHFTLAFDLIISAIAALLNLYQTYRVIHCYFKENNVMLNDQHECVIVDYELSCVFPEGEETIRRNCFHDEDNLCAHTAPEIKETRYVRGTGLYSHKVDVYSAGSMLSRYARCFANEGIEFCGCAEKIDLLKQFRFYMFIFGLFMTLKNPDQRLGLIFVLSFLQMALDELRYGLSDIDLETRENFYALRNVILKYEDIYHHCVISRDMDRTSARFISLFMDLLAKKEERKTKGDDQFAAMFSLPSPL